MLRCPLVCTLLSLYAVLSSTAAQAVAPEVAVGDTVPHFSVRLADGGMLQSVALRGRTFVITFFDTTCGDCRRELPVLQRLYAEMGDSVRFLCIARGESAEHTSRYWAQNGLTLPAAADPTRCVYELFARHIVPRVYVCASDGTITAAFARKAGRRSLARAIRKANKHKRK